MTITPKGKERRAESRLVFMGEIPGRLVHRSLELRFHTLDVSKKGLGILLDPCPEEGEEIHVEFKNKLSSPLRFTVKHIYDRPSKAPDERREGKAEARASMQRCGIELAPGQQESIDLIEIFTRYARPRL